MTQDKSPEAFRTISEVASELELPQHVLRFWETKFSQIKPMKRGGGRRYYRPEEVDLLRGIRHLLYEQGYTIKGAQKILRDQGQKYVADIWRQSAEAAPPEPAVVPVTPTVAQSNYVEPPKKPAGKRAAAANTTVSAVPQYAIGRSSRQALRTVLAELREIREVLRPLQSN